MVGPPSDASAEGGGTTGRVFVLRFSVDRPAVKSVPVDRHDEIANLHAIEEGVEVIHLLGTRVVREMRVVIVEGLFEVVVPNVGIDVAEVRGRQGHASLITPHGEEVLL